MACPCSPPQLDHLVIFAEEYKLLGSSFSGCLQPHVSSSYIQNFLQYDVLKHPESYNMEGQATHVQKIMDTIIILCISLYI